MTFSLDGWLLLLLPVALAILALFWGTPLMALVTELGAAITGRPLPLRLAQQLVRPALVIHPAVWAAVGATLWAASPSAMTSEDALPWTTLAVAMAGSCLTLAWGLTWQAARARRAFHLGLGAMANLCLKYGYWGAVFLAVAPQPEAIPWSLAGLWPLAALFLTACCGPLYLILRRQADDWGRDYYRYAARTLGRWVAGTALLPVAGVAWVWATFHGQANLWLPQVALPALLGLGLAGLAAVLGLALARAEHPMRHKVLMAAVAVLGLVASTLLALAVAEGLTHYAPGWHIPTPVPGLLERLGLV